VVVEAAIDVRQPRMELRTRAEKEGLPLIRQALRAMGQSLGAEPEALHDAELALTEACANAVRHAYRDGEGMVEVAIVGNPTELVATVRDHGVGMPRQRVQPRAGRSGGLGLALIEAIAHDVEIRSERGEGTELTMALPAAWDARPVDLDPIAEAMPEHVLRRLVAMAAAQLDLPPDRIMEAQLVAELIARHASAQLSGERLHVRLDRRDGELEMSIGPFEQGGAETVLHDSRVTGLGSVIERLVERVWTVPTALERAGTGEELALRFAA
jgi:serine/threonine-protein kinase RsbW